MLCVLIYMNFGCYHEVDGVDSSVGRFFPHSFFSFSFFSSLAFSSNRLGILVGFFFFGFVNLFGSFGFSGFVLYTTLLEHFA